MPLSLGIALEDVLGLSPTLWLLPLAAALLAIAVFRSHASRGLAELLIGVALGALLLASRIHAPAPRLGPGPVRLTVLEAPVPIGPLCRFEAFAHSVSPGRLLLRAPAESCDLLPGQWAVGWIQSEPFRPRTNPGGMDVRARWARRGVRLAGRVVDERLLPVRGPVLGLRARLERLRRRIGDVLDPPQPARRSGAVLRALVVGQRQRLDDRVRAPFIRSGTAHLLAVSGLHVGWVFAASRLLAIVALRRVGTLSLLRRTPSLAATLAGGLAVAYALLSGPAVPAIRSVAMAWVGVLAVLGGRPSAHWNSLALAALLVLVLDPAALFSPAFALSFSAVAGILIW